MSKKQKAGTRARASARGKAITINVKGGPMFVQQAAQAWGLRARDIVEAEDTDVVDAYPISEKWGFTSPYLLLERNLESKAMGIGPHLTRFVAACHVLRHYRAMRTAYEDKADAEYWMRAYYVARHAGTMMRADILIGNRKAKSKSAQPGADALHARARVNKEKAIRAYQEGESKNVAEVAKLLAPLLFQSARTISNWLHAFNRGKRITATKSRTP